MMQDALLFNRLRSIMKTVQTIVEQELVPLGLKHSEARILTMLAPDEEYPQDLLADQIEVDRSNVGRALKKLAANQLVERYKNPFDARAFVVKLTEQGQVVQEKMRIISRYFEQTLLIGISKDELDNLMTLLDRVNQNLTSDNFNNIKTQCCDNESQGE